MTLMTVMPAEIAVSTMSKVVVSGVYTLAVSHVSRIALR